MSEFKFSCPVCGQHIQADVQYVGRQINCPACKQAIIIPQSAQSAATPPPPALPPRPGTVTLPPYQRTAVVQVAAAPPPKKSGALKMVVGVAALLVVAALGFLGVQFALHHFGGSKPKANPAAQVAAPTADQAVQALSILTKVHSAYTNVNTVKVEGTLALYLNLSNLTMGDVSPNMPAGSASAKRRPPGVPRIITNSTAIIIKQGPSNFYYFDGEAVTKMDRQVITNTFAFWSSDQGRFMFNDSHYPGVPPTYMQMAAANPTDDPAQQYKNMQHLFEDPANLTKIIKDLGQTEDETVNGQDCYTLTAKVLGQKVKIWVDKSSYLIPQWQITLGGSISDADIDDAFSLVAIGYTNAPAAQMDMIKSQVKMIAPAMEKIRGTISSTTDSMEVNPTLVAADFNYAVPPGVRLIKMPNPAAPARPPN